MELRDSVKNFTYQMEEVLRENDNKGGWRNCSRKRLLEYLKTELDELEGALINGDESEIQKESIDIANFAHMIWDNIDFLQKSRSE